MPGGAPGRCANARTTGCGERRAGDAKSEYSDALTGEMAARTIPLYVYLFLTGRTRRGFPFFVLARPSERRKSCRETPVLRRTAIAICAGRPRRDAGKDTTDCTGMLTSGASAGGQEKADTRGKNGVQFEHLQYARRSSTGERPLSKGCHDDDTPCTEAATSHPSGTAWRCRCESCRRAQTENIRRCDGRQELPERHGRVFGNLRRARPLRAVRPSERRKRKKERP